MAFVFLALGLLTLLSGCSSAEDEPTAFTILSLPQSTMIGHDPDFTFQVNVAGSTPTAAYYDIRDASGFVLMEGVSSPYSDYTTFSVNVPLPVYAFVGPMTIRVSDAPDFSSARTVTATQELEIDQEINKVYDQLTKGVRVSGDVSALDNVYGDFVDVIRVPNAAAGETITIDFDHLDDPGKYADVHLYDAQGQEVYVNTSVPDRGQALINLEQSGTYYLYLYFNSNAGYQEHWYYVTWN